MSTIVSFRGCERQSYFNPVDPDKVAAIQCNGIATPNVLRVELGNVDVLQNNILFTHDTETFTLDDTC